MKIFYMGLEPYEGRYTLQLTDWTERVYKKRGIDYVIVPGTTIDNSKAIVTGQVLDAHGRSYFGMSQMMNLVRMMKSGEITSDDAIFFEDMFQPGMESLPYIIQQSPEQYRPKIFLRCLAQAIDPDDFVHVWGMSKWMSLYEEMCNEIPNVHILATNEEMVAHMRIANWRAPIYNISGLSFGKQEVLSRVKSIKPFDQRTKRVCFAARFDQEKQPDFYMDLIQRVRRQDNSIEFAVFSGGPLRSNNEKYLTRARELESKGDLKIYENLKKDQYYELLADSRVLFNCALQDWVSNTVSEADTLGCNVLFPAYRSFPETFANDRDRLYIPWSQEDAYQKLNILLMRPHANIGKLSDWTNGTIDRMIDIMTGKGEQWRRDGKHYRDWVSESKY
jgi:glycosyltransferase involved in cell wall biosynthesis